MEGKRKFYIPPHAEKYNIHVTKFVSLFSCLLALAGGLPLCERCHHSLMHSQYVQRKCMHSG